MSYIPRCPWHKVPMKFVNKEFRTEYDIWFDETDVYECHICKGISKHMKTTDKLKEVSDTKLYDVLHEISGEITFLRHGETDIKIRADRIEGTPAAYRLIYLSMRIHMIEKELRRR